MRRVLLAAQGDAGPAGAQRRTCAAGCGRSRARSTAARVRILNIIEFINRLLAGGLTDKLTSPLAGLKVAPYYGCLLSRGEDIIDGRRRTRTPSAWRPPSGPPARSPCRGTSPPSAAAAGFSMSDDRRGGRPLRPDPGRGRGRRRRGHRHRVPDVPLEPGHAATDHQPADRHRASPCRCCTCRNWWGWRPAWTRRSSAWTAISSTRWALPDRAPGMSRGGIGEQGVMPWLASASSSAIAARTSPGRSTWPPSPPPPRKLPGVVHAVDYKYMCSDPGQQMIKQAIARAQAHGRGRGGVQPADARAHLPPRRRRGGPEPVPAGDGQHPRALLVGPRATAPPPPPRPSTWCGVMVEKVKRNRSLHPIRVPVEPTALVIGGGIAGIQAALDIANGGQKVILVEKEPSIGGHMARLSETFPTLDCSQCILTPRMVEVASAPEHHADDLQRGRGRRGVRRQLRGHRSAARPATSTGPSARAAATAGPSARSRRSPASSTPAWACARPSTGRSRRPCPTSPSSTPRTASC